MRKQNIAFWERLYLIGLLCFLLPFISNGQLIQVENITEKYGINRKEIYRIFEDRQGYLWITTATGVFRFDGHEFDEVSGGSELQFSVAYNVFEDQNGDVCFLDNRDELFKYDGSKFQRIVLDKTGIAGRLSAHVACLFTDSLNQLYLGFGTGAGFMVFDANGKHNKSAESIKNETCLYIDKQCNKDFFYFFIERDVDGEHLASKENVLPLKLMKDSWDSTLFLPIANPQSAFKHFRYFSLKDDRSALTLESRVYFIKGDGSYIVKDFDKAIVYAYEDDQGIIWICELNGEVYALDKDLNSLNLELSQLKNLTVTTIFQDDQGGYWFATYEKGLFYSQGMRFKKFAHNRLETSGAIVNICSDDSSGIYSCSSNGWVYQLDSNFNVLKTWHGPNKAMSLSNMKGVKYQRELGVLTVGTPFDLSVINLRNDEIFKPVSCLGFNVYDIEILNDSLMIVLNSKGAHIVSRDWDDTYRQAIAEHYRFFKGEKGRDGEIWLSTQRGLKVYEMGKLRDPLPNDVLFDRSLYGIAMVDDELWGLSTKYGLLIKREDSVIHIGSDFGLPDYGLMGIARQNDSVFWIGGHEGLFRLTRQKGTYKVQKLGSSEGFPKGSVNELVKSGNHIWLNISGSIWRFSPSEITFEKTSSPLYITKIEMGEKIFAPTEIGSLQYGDEVLSFHFRSLNFTKQGKINYQYRLLGASDQWVNTNQPTAIYTAMNPGKYTFEVRAENNDGSWTHPQEVSFSILPAFWQTWWFKALIVVFLSGITYWGFDFRARQKMEKEALKTELAQLELKALKAQISPHFIFNSISSVQYYLSKNKPEDAQKYMNEFAQLIRKVLEHSDSNFVTLESELTMMDKYIKLESKKFKENGIELEMMIQEEINPRRVSILPGLFQPYVENSIWHGLERKKGQRIISIRVNQRKKRLLIEVEDNGIGRDAAQRRRAGVKESRSFGMSIATQRIQVLNGSKTNKFVEVVDLKDNDGTALGTRVTLSIPYKLMTI